MTSISIYINIYLATILFLLTLTIPNFIKHTSRDILIKYDKQVNLLRRCRSI